MNTCLDVPSQYDLDSIDIDWEYPDPGTSATNYTRLMQQLCTALHGRGKQCTAAVVAQGGQGGGISSAVFSAVDYLMIMAYDGGTGAANSPYSYAVSSLDYWLNRGLGSEQTLGSGYAFRSEQSSVTSLNNWAARVNTGAAGSLRVPPSLSPRCSSPCGPVP